MTFPNQPTLVPTSIGRIDHFVDDIDGTNPGRSVRYNLAVLDQNGDILRVLPRPGQSNDEQPHMTAAQINQILTFMDVRRANLPDDIRALGQAQNPPQDWFPAGNVCGRITWRFRDLDGTNPNRSLHARVIERTAGGQFVRVHQINDQLNMTGPQATAAIQFLNDQRAKAVAQIL